MCKHVLVKLGSSQSIVVGKQLLIQRSLYAVYDGCMLHAVCVRTINDDSEVVVWKSGPQQQALGPFPDYLMLYTLDLGYTALYSGQRRSEKTAVN